VPFIDHLADVLSAGFGTLPFIGAIRNARLPFASFAGLPLVDLDVAVRSDERRLRLHGCSLCMRSLTQSSRQVCSVLLCRCLAPGAYVAFGAVRVPFIF